MYLDKFLCLRMKDALILFAKDFSQLHPSSVGRFQQFWRASEDHLIEKIRLLKIKEANFTELINLLFGSNPDEKTSIVLSLLPYLIAPQRSGRKRKSVEGETTEQALPPRLSLDERSKSFFIHIPDVVNLEAVLEAGINHTTRFSLQHQPIPIIVDPFENIAASYIILENLIYEADSILYAFKSTFHICYAVNCDYPPNARTVWIFLQQAFLNIAHATDKLPISVLSLIGRGSKYYLSE